MLRKRQIRKSLCILICSLLLLNSLCASAAVQDGSILSAAATTNMVAGLGYTVTPAPSASYPDADSKELTDGIYGRADLFDTSWQGLTSSGNPISIEFALPETKSITGIKVDFLQSASSGIYLPDSEIKMYVSTDKITWTLLKNIQPEKQPEEVITKSYEWVLDQDGINGDLSETSFSAQYVKVEIKSTLEWVFIDEIEVMGTDASVVTNTPKNLAADLSVTSPGAIGYSYSTAPDNSGADSGGMLTDNIYGTTAFWNGNWVKFNGMSTKDIIFNLGDFKSVSAIHANFLKDGPSGIFLPGDYDISVSDDGNRWVSLKSSNVSDTIPDGISKVGWDGASDKIPGASADETMAYIKYVKVSFAQISAWIFIDEIEVLGFDGLQQGAVSLWDNGGGNPNPDPDAPQNLALGKDYTVSEPPLTYLDSGKELTNGRYGTNDFGDPEWVGHSGGALTRTFIFDLGSDSSISEISTNFLFDAGVRINFPGRYDISVSQDGQLWSTLPSDIMFVNPEESPVIYKATWLANNNITPNKDMTDAQVYGRYVKIVTGTSGWTFLDEVEIIGQAGKTAAAVTLPPDSAIIKDYLKSGENTAGIKNLLLGYNGFYANNVGNWTKEDFIPYVSYVDKEGKPIDTFFDGILLLGLRNPGGRTFAATNNIEQASYKDDWQWYLDKTFAADGDLNSLNEAMKEVSEKLGKTGLKEKVVISIPFPDPIQLDFGDVDGDGISECLNPSVDPVNAIANQKKVVKWYIDELLKKWNESGYSNLELSGLYWLEEGVNKGDVEKYTSSLAHENNLKMFWIPWFGATGYPQWKRFGFDAVAFQPNHSFDGTSTQRLSDAANFAKEYGMGIELELDAPAVQGDKDKYKRYIDYLDMGIKEGYMGESGDGSYRAYYQDVKALKTAAESATPKTRFLYDATYNFTKGTYKSGYVQYLNAGNITYNDLLDIDDALIDIAKKLQNTSLTQEEKDHLESEQLKVEALRSGLMNIKSSYDAIMTSFLTTTVTNVTMNDYDNFVATLDSIQLLLDSKNLTTRQRSDLVTKKAKLVSIFNVISMVKNTIDKITLLPEAKDVVLSHSNMIHDANKLYSTLNTYQKTYIDESLVTKLNGAVSALEKLTPSSSGNTTAGGNDSTSGNKEVTPVVTTAQPEIIGNTALTSIDDKALSKAFENVIPTKDGKKTVLINVGAVNGVFDYTQRFPAAAVSTNSGGRKIQVNTPAATVTIPANMLIAQDIKDASNVDLSIGTVATEKLSNAIKQQIGNRPVIELNLKVEGKALAWKNLSAPVTISIDYQPTAEELKNPDHIVVLYIDGAGNVLSVPSGRYDKATGKVTFTATHFSKYAVAFVNKTFNDISKYTWAVKPVEVLSSRGVIEGTTENTFSPGNNITRGDYLLWLVNTLGLTTTFDTNFNDVKTTDKYYEALGIAKKLGISAGTGNNNFSPEKQISRQDIMVLTIKALKIARFNLQAGTSADVNTYSDFSNIANYAVNDVATMVKSGLIAGSGNNRLSPTGTTTRAEASVILYKIYTKK